MSIFNKGNGNNVLMPPELAYRVAQTVQKEEETTQNRNNHWCSIHPTYT